MDKTLETLRLEDEINKTTKGQDLFGCFEVTRKEKLSQSDCDNIRKLRTPPQDSTTRMPSYNEIARYYGVCTQTIYRICNPEYREKERASSKKWRVSHQDEIKKAQKKRLAGKKHYGFYFDIPSDKDLCEFLDQLPNRTQYIRDLIRKDIAERKERDDSL